MTTTFGNSLIHPSGVASPEAERKVRQYGADADRNPNPASVISTADATTILFPVAAMPVSQ
jgi:hypothetical protein